MKKVLKSKWLYFLMAVIVGILVFPMLHHSPISERGVVVGLAIDEEDGELVISAQVILPSAGGEANGSSIVVEEKAKTLGLAIEKISGKLGVKASLSHCNIIIVNKAVFEKNMTQGLLYLQKQGEARDNSMIIATEEKASSMFEKSAPVGDLGSLYLQNMLHKQSKGLGVNEITLRSFCKNYFSAKNVNCMPYATKKLQNMPPEGNGETNKEVQVFDMSKSLVVAKGGGLLVLDKQMSDGYSIVKSDAIQGQIATETADGYTVSAQVSSIEKKVEFDPIEGKVFVKINAICRLVDSENQDLTSWNNGDFEKEKRAIALYLKEGVEKCFVLGKNSGVDIFDVHEGFMRQGAKKWLLKLGDDYLKGIQVVVESNSILK